MDLPQGICRLKNGRFRVSVFYNHETIKNHDYASMDDAISALLDARIEEHHRKIKHIQDLVKYLGGK